MPQHKTVAKLESLALHQFCQIGARTCTALEEGGNFDIENNGTGDSVTISSDFESFFETSAKFHFRKVDFVYVENYCWQSEKKTKS